MICCRNCHEPFPLRQFPHRCPACGGLYGFKEGLHYDADKVRKDLPGIWPYQSSFSLPSGAVPITLGEGNTPLVWTELLGLPVGLKLESLNPSGSFKDRGTAVLFSWLAAAGIETAVEDSSGNAGASFAAYASRANMQGRVYIPEYASGPKRSQIEAYGCEVIPVPGPRSRAAQAALDQVDQGAVYASHAYLPHGTAGIATIAYELTAQLGAAPGTVLMPVGHGSLLLGVSLGFQALLECGRISELPRIIGIQAGACDPLARAFKEGKPAPVPVPENRTIAEGVAIAAPFHGREVLAAVRRSGGEILAVEEELITQGQLELARLGFDVEMTAALVWGGLQKLTEKNPDPLICLISGHGLKND